MYILLLYFHSAFMASLSVVKEKLSCWASLSKTLKPILCRVFSYSAPMFPKPAIKYFISHKNKRAGKIPTLVNKNKSFKRLFLFSAFSFFSFSFSTLQRTCNFDRSDWNFRSIYNFNSFFFNISDVKRLA